MNEAFFETSESPIVFENTISRQGFKSFWQAIILSFASLTWLPYGDKLSIAWRLHLQAALWGVFVNQKINLLKQKETQVKIEVLAVKVSPK